MDKATYLAYLAWSIPNYAQENIRSGRWSLDAGLQKAEEEYQQLLPDGLASHDQYLFSIKDKESGKNVGILWFGIQERGGKRGAFVYDVKIDEQFRRQGYGEQAFLAMEEKVYALGLETIGLYVFGQNYGARAMYDKLGYEATNIMMSKKLKSEQR
ncbi:MAG: GNAT family N-acetyltransferase [Ktedonobacteraceae bacterium]|nr:GNAT family N-acetyltransferase [Ktedonobacteraceae bacterium]